MFVSRAHHAPLCKYLILDAAFGLISIFWVYFMIPETRGRPMEELNRLFELGLPARAFKDYQLDAMPISHHEPLEDVDFKEQTEHDEQQRV